MPPDARLGDAPHLQEIRGSGARLDLAPRHVVQQGRPATGRDRVRRALRGGGAAALVHIGFAAALVALLSTRDNALPRPEEHAIDVAVVPDIPRPPAAAAPNADKLKRALASPSSPAPAPDPHPPAPPQLQPPAPQVEARPAAAPVAPEAPKLLAPPPEPTRAAARETADKPANLAPEDDAVDRARREFKPAEVPRTLTTADAGASFAVPLPAPSPPKPTEAPTPPIPAKEPSAAEKLAAALPMDTSAMPSSFRAVLAGDGARVSAAYKGLVYGRFNRHPEIGERARRQHLKGHVIIAFAIDDAGAISQISVLQSSGDPAVDALGLDMIRASAPFPPPPLDAQRSFTPALAFGP